jgi:hypothetical protein
VVVVVGLSACGDNISATPTPPPWTSGERLQVATLVTDDGFVGLRGVYDRELDLECGFDPGSADSCPVPGVIIYADPGCSMPLIRSLGGSPDRFVRSRGVVYDVGAPYDGPSFGWDDAGACVETATYGQLFSVSVGDQMRFQLVLDEPRAFDGVAYDTQVSDDGFTRIVKFQSPGSEEIDTQATSRLRVRYERSGPLRREIGIYDSELGVPCTPTHIAGDGDLRCLNLDGYSWIPTFTTPDCSDPPHPALYGNSGFAFSYTDASAITQLFRCDRQITTPEYEATATCHPVPLTVYGCDEIPLAGLPRLVPAVAPGL